MNIKEYLKQLSIVILGILIAFWVSNLGVYFKERATQQQVLQTVLNELKDNNEAIAATRHSLDTLQMIYTKIKIREKVSEGLEIKYSGLSLKSAAYETAKYTGIFKDVDYTLTSKIVENYESQNSLKETEKLMFDELLLSIKNKDIQSKNVDYVLLQILNLIENLKQYEVEQKLLIDNLVKEVEG
jgi:hypothetical protein